MVRSYAILDIFVIIFLTHFEDTDINLSEVVSHMPNMN
jgi:hypothetical protein